MVVGSQLAATYHSIGDYTYSICKRYSWVRRQSVAAIVKSKLRCSDNWDILQQFDRHVPKQRIRLEYRQLACVEDTSRWSEDVEWYTRKDKLRTRID